MFDCCRGNQSIEMATPIKTFQVCFVLFWKIFTCSCSAQYQTFQILLYSAQCQTFWIFGLSSVSNILDILIQLSVKHINILVQLSVKPPKLGDLKNADLKNSYTFHATLPNQAGTILIAFDHLIFQVAWCNDDLGTKFSRFFTEGIQQCPPVNIELLDEFINRRYDLSWSS